MYRSQAETRILRLKWRRTVDRWRRKAACWVAAAKAGYDPNQPRVPAGSPDGGQWTGGDGSGSGSGSRRRRGRDEGRVLSDATPDNLQRPSARLAQARGNGPKGPEKPFRPKKRRPSPVKKLDVPVNKPPAKAKGPLPPKPDIPTGRPPIKQLENRVAKQVGKWLLKAAARRAIGPIGIALDAIELAIWIHGHVPDMQSYFDGAQPLNILQDAVDDPLVGYEIYHIVERAAVANDGIGHNRVNARENLVRIPTWKHHEITAWYMTKNDDFSGLAPRHYLHGKSWEEKYDVGLKALRKHGVLK